MDTLINNFELIVNNKGKLREEAIEKIRHFIRNHGKEARGYCGCYFHFPDNILFYVSSGCFIKPGVNETCAGSLSFKASDISTVELLCYNNLYDESSAGFGVDINKEFSNEGILNLLRFLKRIEMGIK